MQTCERFAHHRTGEYVTADDDMVDLCATHFFEDGFKRRQVSVNVVERSNPLGHIR
jgi:hypothetical protein